MNPTLAERLSEAVSTVEMRTKGKRRDYDRRVERADGKIGIPANGAATQ